MNTSSSNTVPTASLRLPLVFATEMWRSNIANLLTAFTPLIAPLVWFFSPESPTGITPWVFSAAALLATSVVFPWSVARLGVVLPYQIFLRRQVGRRLSVLTLATHTDSQLRWGIRVNAAISVALIFAALSF